MNKLCKKENMKGLNKKSNLKPVPNSFMSADQWSEEVKKQKE